MGTRMHLSYRIKASNKGGNVVEREGKKTGKKVVEATDEKCVGFVRHSAGMTLSEGFNAVRVDISLEVPWLMKPGSKRDVERGMEFTKNIIDDCISDRVGEINEVLAELNSRKSPRKVSKSGR